MKYFALIFTSFLAFGCVENKPVVAEKSGDRGGQDEEGYGRRPEGRPTATGQSPTRNSWQNTTSPGQQGSNTTPATTAPSACSRLNTNSMRFYTYPDTLPSELPLKGDCIGIAWPMNQLYRYERLAAPAYGVVEIKDLNSSSAIRFHVFGRGPATAGRRYNAGADEAGNGSLFFDRWSTLMDPFESYFIYHSIPTASGQTLDLEFKMETYDPDNGSYSDRVLVQGRVQIQI